MNKQDKAIKALNKAFDKWLEDGSGGRKSEKDIEWHRDYEDDDTYRWKWNYKNRTYIWSYVYNSGKIEKVVL